MKDWNYENDQWTKLPPHLKHLPLFTRNIDLVSISFRYLWAIFLKLIAFRFYIRLKVKGDYVELYKKYPRLILISNHASHLDAVSIAASIPAPYWIHLFIAAAKDYFFTNPVFTFFSQHCLGAIPIDRNDRRGEAIRLITSLLQSLPRMWLILFPEGTRSKDGKIHDFKRGVSLFALRTNTPILFLYLEGNSALWPKGAPMPRPGKLTIHVGPVKEPAPIEKIYRDYRKWVTEIDPTAFINDEIPDWQTRGMQTAESAPTQGPISTDSTAPPQSDFSISATDVTGESHDANDPVPDEPLDSDLDQEYSKSTDEVELDPDRDPEAMTLQQMQSESGLDMDLDDVEQASRIAFRHEAQKSKSEK